MTAAFAIALALLYHAAAGMKRGRWEHAGQLAETAAVAGLVWLVLGDVWLVAGLVLLGNVLFQAFTNRSFGVDWLDADEAWTFELTLFGHTWNHPKPLWLPPSLPGYWRLPQLVVAVGLIAWRLLP